MFGSFAQDYEKWRPGYPQSAVEWLIPAGAARVADVGAGTGKLTGALLAGGLEVVAIEPDPAMLAVLRDVHPTAEAHRGWAGALPIPDDSVDAVFVAQAWHWFPHDDAFAEAQRVVRPGGVLGLIWNAPAPQAPFEFEVNRLTSSVPAQPAGSEPDDEPIAGLPAEGVETAVFEWTWELSPTHLRAVVATYSMIAIMPEAERAARLDEVFALASTAAAELGTATVPLRQRTLCARVRL